MDHGTIKKILVAGGALIVALLIVGLFLGSSDDNEVKTGGYVIPQESSKIVTGGHLVTPDPAMEVLETIPVKGKAPVTGYRRSEFGRTWTDDVDVDGGHNGCDTRNDILRRDLVNVVPDVGCRVMAGLLHDPYTGRDIQIDRGEGTAILIQIDHIVPLKDAWQKGAQQWDERKRVQFANDPLNLVAVGHQVNKAKRDADVATWLPPNKAFRCDYVGRVVQVKAKYGVWMNPAEHEAAAHVLNQCSLSGGN